MSRQREQLLKKMLAAAYALLERAEAFARACSGRSAGCRFAVFRIML
ncbi:MULTISPECIES: hypothetical protein [unclassified Bradyrhizobium]|nr:MULTISPECIES: hypothetical protein [unclassified Bradyrhizobium]MCK1332654.1 hypothetical protein [Bradyrhizobium sp. CW9]MCK1291933.1 hypothetical protein [Bradyrhizobium sp. 30]MCK1309530.1 hypothetical protein [Bradyrhizobium sp. 45]MCK1349262.1 hypothetical protein [Bradyrhizobium sp. CW11]MCK1510068.1 hypothetical protein [Bradyrhizobium sp. 18]